MTIEAALWRYLFFILNYGVGGIVLQRVENYKPNLKKIYFLFRIIYGFR